MTGIILYLIYFLIGLFSGISMGVIGVGAGMLTIPLLIYTGLTVKESVAVSLIMQLLPQSLPGVMLYYKNNIITLPLILIAIFVVLGSLFGIYAGSYLVNNNWIDLTMMYKLLSFTLIASGIYIYYKYIYRHYGKIEVNND